MNFDEAVVAHSAWKTKLRNYLGKPDKSLNPSDIERDDACELGKWIHSEGRQRGADPAFLELRQAHANFHKAAASLVRRANAGERVDQEAALGAHSPFASASAEVIQLIMKMKARLQQPVGR